jgi:hypothetical protein
MVECRHHAYQRKVDNGDTNIINKDSVHKQLVNCNLNSSYCGLSIYEFDKLSIVSFFRTMKSEAAIKAFKL